MGDFWRIFKEQWNKQLEDMGYPCPPQSSGTGSYETTGGSSSESGDDYWGEWELVYQKFRDIERRDPYSFQELVDWWNRI